MNVAILSPSGQEWRSWRIIRRHPTAVRLSSGMRRARMAPGCRVASYLVQVTATLPEGQVARSVRMLVLAR